MVITEFVVENTDADYKSLFKSHGNITKVFSLAPHHMKY